MAVGPGPAPSAPATETLGQLLQGSGVHSVFQPIVDLETRRLCGYEALVRGPAGSAYESPVQLFAAAAAEGRLVELDAACQRAAVEGAVARGVASPQTLLVNVEPDTVSIEPLPPIGPGCGRWSSSPSGR